MGSSHRVVTGPRVLPPEPQPDPLPALPLTVPDALRRTGRVVPWRWIAVAAAIVVAVAAYPVINALRSHPSAAHQAAGTRPAASSHAPARKPVVVAKTRPVPQVAPRSAGFITKITQVPEATCRAGSPCAITVRIFIGQLTDTATMSWSFVVVDRCTGAQTPVAGGTMIAEPWWRSAYDTRTVQLPAGRALAVVARVDDPVQAASAPLFVSDGRTAC
jgi:hypothetical protein